MLLDKDKIRLLIITEATTCLPGQHVTGVLRVEVLKEVSVTAIRLLARGQEAVFFKAKKDRFTITRQQSFVHFEHLITFFGFSKECGRRGGASLAPGIYEYPFDFEIPASAPPTYNCHTSAGDAEIAYVLRAIADIPHGFDKRTEIPLYVLPTIASQQYEQLCRTDKTMVTRDIPLAVEPGCFGRSRDPKASVTLSVSVPAVALLPWRSCGNTSPASSPTATNYLNVHLSLMNTSLKTPIRTVRVTLSQQQHLIAQGDSYNTIQPIVSVVVSPPGGELIPRASAALDVKLRLPRSLRHLSKMPQRVPLPTLATPCIQTSNLLTISFPGLGADALVNMSDATVIGAAVDYNSRVPIVPCFYTMATIRPEDKLGGE
ncbi:Arrestin (or S-antigen), N-terminal domain containing protein, putative [Leishmania guyanensis]